MTSLCLAVRLTGYTLLPLEALGDLGSLSTPQGSPAPQGKSSRALEHRSYEQGWIETNVKQNYV